MNERAVLPAPELVARAAVAAALAELRAEMDNLLFNKRHNTPAEAIMAAASELDATIAALGLSAETGYDDHAADCPCAWCRVERQNTKLVRKIIKDVK